MTELVDVKRLSVIFQHTQHSVVAVDKINFSLHAGKTLALLGESGCGKSLTANALMRLLPRNVCYGRRSAIVYEKKDILDLPEVLMQGLRGRRFAMIFQEPMTALNPVLTIGSQLKETALKKQKIDLISLLDEVELPNPEQLLKKYPHQLSGGQKQRVMIAMALAGQPDVLIADEPTTALDVTIQAQILALLKKLQQRHQMSILLITHDLGVVKAIADHVCVMYAGQIVEMAEDTDVFFEKPLHPYSQQLLKSIPSLQKRDQVLYTIKGQVPVIGAMPSGCRFHPRCEHAFALCARRMPWLQDRPSKRQVRCHLYPQHDYLPEISSSFQLRKKDYQLLQQQEIQPLLSVNNVTIQYRQFVAVNQVSFEILPGKVLALVGESGCGKTSLARAILCLLPIISGQIKFAGNCIHHMQSKKMRDYRSKVQMIFQDPYSAMNPKMTVSEILYEALLPQQMNRINLKKRKLELLDLVNLPQNSLYRYPHQFSGGQRQRICIARALACNPALLVCDEPTSALDVSVQAQILNLLRMLQYELGLTYLLITHNIGIVSYLADDILVMRQGQKIEQGSCEQILRQPKHEYTQLLLQSALVL